MTGHRFDPHSLDEDDFGVTSAAFNLNARAKNDGFCAAMRKAIRRREENATEGVSVVPHGEARVLRSVRLPATFVPSMSSLENV